MQAADWIHLAIVGDAPSRHGEMERNEQVMPVMQRRAYAALASGLPVSHGQS